MLVQNVNFSQTQKPYCFRKNSAPLTFKSETVYEKNKFYEKDLLSVDSPKYLYSNVQNPSQEVLGATVKRVSDDKIDILSRYQHIIGEIKYNPKEKQPMINFQVGSFQPVIELQDDELGITVLMTRGSKISGKNLNINYKHLTKPTIPNISFGRNNLYVTTGYMPHQTKSIVDSYMWDKDFKSVPKSRYTHKLKSDYTIVGLAGGMGSRLCPISDLEYKNKPATRYAGSQKTLLDVSVLDTAATAGKINDYGYLEDTAKNLSGTAGIVIKGIKDGTIPTDKPLVLLTGDTYNNIDLAKALYAFEKDKNCGMALIVKPIKEREVFDKSLVKLRNDSNSENEGNNTSKTAIIDAFSEKFDASNISKYSEYRSEPVTNLDDSGKLYTSTNIMVLKPEILNILKDYADADGKADFIEFLGLMFNVLNKPTESLKSKYPDGLKSKNLSLSSISHPNGLPKTVWSNEGRLLQLKAITASGINNQEVQWSDMGTVEDYVSTIRQISYDRTGNNSLAESVRSCIDSNNVIYMDYETRNKIWDFKEKYGIDKIEGNVIVHSRPVIKPAPKPVIQKVPQPPVSDSFRQPKNAIFWLTRDEKAAQGFINEIFTRPASLRQTKEEMTVRYGFDELLRWYMAPNGYIEHYEKYVENLFNKANSLEELLKFAPNWAPWKLEEKYWMMQHPSLANSSEASKQAFYRDNDSKVAQPIKIGKLPELFANENDFEKLISKLKTTDCKEDSLYLNFSRYDVKRLKGGELNDKFIYLIERNGEKAILKFDRINVEDSDTVNGRELSIHEKRTIRKNKHIAI